MTPSPTRSVVTGDRRPVRSLPDESAGRPRRSDPRGAGRRGKSGLHRAGWLSTTTRREPRDSATENRPPAAFGRAGEGETVV